MQTASRSSRYSSVSRYAGFTAPVVGLGGIAAAILVSSTFDWSHSALSDLGVAPATALLFNGGLIVAAILALAFVWSLGNAATTALERLVAVEFTLAAITMGLVGVFLEGTPLHLPIAVSFYLLLTATLATDGITRRNELTGVLCVALAVLHFAVWYAWVRGIVPGGLAVPETFGALLLGAWIYVLGPLTPFGRRW